MHGDFLPRSVLFAFEQQRLSIKGQSLISFNGALLTSGKIVAKVAILRQGHKGWFLISGRQGETGVEARQKRHKESIGRVLVRYLNKTHLLEKPVLKRSPKPLHSPLCLWREGGDTLHAQLMQYPLNLAHRFYACKLLIDTGFLG